MFGRYKEIHGIRVGHAKVKPATPTHVHGMKRGNATGHYNKQTGHLPDERSTARRSTGINARQHDPILPGMPNLSPG